MRVQTPRLAASGTFSSPVEPSNLKLHSQVLRSQKSSSQGSKLSKDYQLHEFNKATVVMLRGSMKELKPTTLSPPPSDVALCQCNSNAMVAVFVAFTFLLLAFIIVVMTVHGNMQYGLEPEDGDW